MSQTRINELSTKELQQYVNRIEYNWLEASTYCMQYTPSTSVSYGKNVTMDLPELGLPKRGGTEINYIDRQLIPHDFTDKDVKRLMELMVKNAQDQFQKQWLKTLSFKIPGCESAFIYQNEYPNGLEIRLRCTFIIPT